jgi:hypothetical protein
LNTILYGITDVDADEDDADDVADDAEEGADEEDASDGPFTTCKCGRTSQLSDVL